MPQLGGHRDLARVGPGELVGRRERDVRPEQRLDGHRRDHAGRPHQPVRVGEDERPDRAHHLGPVEERQALLRLERQRLQAGVAQRLCGRLDGPIPLHLAQPDERQRQVRQRREVAGRPDAPLLRHDRVDPEAQEVEQAVHEERPAAAVAERERVGPQQQHRPDDLARERRSPTPAAWLISRLRWRRPASSGAIVVDASAPNPVVTP